MISFAHFGSADSPRLELRPGRQRLTQHWLQGGQLAGAGLTPEAGLDLRADGMVVFSAALRPGAQDVFQTGGKEFVSGLWNGNVVELFLGNSKTGRYLEVQFGNLSVVSLYVPSGSASEEAQAKKFRFLAAFMPFLQALKKSGREIVMVGDWNIAHKEIDLKNWRGNKKNSGFLPEERAWLDKLFDDVGYVDTFRRLIPLPDQYTWWSNRGNARENNVGWRIDYHICTPGIAATAEYARIYKDNWFSDHAPLSIDYDFAL